MYIVFVPNIRNRIQQYFCLDRQRNVNRDVISHILSFLPIALSTKNYFFIRNFTGKTYSIYVRKYQTWGDVKKNIEEKYDIPISKQRIVIQGLIVYNNQMVNINYINRICCVHLVIQQ